MAFEMETGSLGSGIRVTAGGQACLFSRNDGLYVSGSSADWSNMASLSKIARSTIGGLPRGRLLPYDFDIDSTVTLWLALEGLSLK